MSTVRGEVSGVTLANEIWLERAAHKGSFLLVEGSTDANLFKKFVEQEICSITVCLGKQNLIDAARILESMGFPGALGVADKDLMDIVGGPPVEGDVLFTDETDFEVMILSSSALSDVLLEFGVEDKISALESALGYAISDEIFRAASFVGAFRLISSREGWNLKFEGMTYRFQNSNSFELDERRTVRQILSRSHEPPPISDEHLISMIVEERAKWDNSRQICCGHDCVRHLGRALRQAIGNTNDFNGENGAKLLGKVLRVAYNSAQFRETGLYHNIRSWEGRTGYQILSADV